MGLGFVFIYGAFKILMHKTICIQQPRLYNGRLQWYILTKRKTD